MDYAEIREQIAPRIEEEEDLQCLYYLKGLVDGRIEFVRRKNEEE